MKRFGPVPIGLFALAIGLAQGCVQDLNDDASGDNASGPAAPTSVTATATSSTAVLTWTAVDGAETYQVFQGTGETAVATVTAPTVTATITGLTASTAYTFSVKTCVAETCSATGTSVSVTTSSTSGGGSSTELEPPTTFEAFPSDSAVILTWGAVLGATEYKIFQDGGTTPVATVAVPGVSFEITGLSFDTEYVFTIYSCAGTTCSAEGTSVTARTIINNFEVKVTLPDASLYTRYVTRAGDRTVANCIADEGEWIECRVDVEELDLHNHGLTLFASVPFTQCKYLKTYMYYYSVAPWARVNHTPAPDTFQYFPPVEAEITNDTDGAVTHCRYRFTVGGSWYDCRGFIDPDNDGEQADAAPATLTADLGQHNVGGAVYTVHVAQDGTPYVRESISSQAQFKCPFDYSQDPYYPDGKNCCKYSYAKTVIDDGEVGDSVDTDWGGSVSNCIRGPATHSHPLTDFGIPSALYTTIPLNGHTETYAIKEPLNIDTDYDYPFEEQYFAANYFNPISDADPDPQGDPEIIDLVDSDFPKALRGLTGFPYYRYDCLDPDHEVISRIDVRIQEWNKLGQLEADGDPNEVGTETAPFNAEPINDFSDWDDLIDADGDYFPGF